MAMKPCTLCGETKPPDAFDRDAQKRDGRRSSCKACNRDRYRANVKRWRKGNPAALEAQKRRHYERHKSEILAEKNADYADDKARYVARRFGISRQSAEALLASEACAICDRRFDIDETPTIDHDHACCPGKPPHCGSCVRGAVCRNCNLILGFAGDDARTLLAAVEYLANRSSTPISGSHSNLRRPQNGHT